MRREQGVRGRREEQKMRRSKYKTTDGVINVSVRIPRFKEPKNAAENELVQIIKAQGIQCNRQGWPDYYMVTRSGRFICIEVKKNDDQLLKNHQHFVMSQLHTHGICCYRWSPDVQFTQVFSHKPSERVPIEWVFA